MGGLTLTYVVIFIMKNFLGVATSTGIWGMIGATLLFTLVGYLVSMQVSEVIQARGLTGVLLPMVMLWATFVYILPRVLEKVTWVEFASNDYYFYLLAIQVVYYLIRRKE